MALRMACTIVNEGAPASSGYGSSFLMTCSRRVRLRTTCRIVASRAAMPSALTEVTKDSGRLLDSTRIRVADRYLRGAICAATTPAIKRTKKGIRTWRG